jgi:hypothetical protein
MKWLNYELHCGIYHGSIKIKQKNVHIKVSCSIPGLSYPAPTTPEDEW